MEANFKKFEQMDMKRLIIKMALPAMISMIVQALYNIVDSIFVAMISEEALTALSLAFPLQMIIISIFAGLGVGINSYMSRMLGAKNRDEAINTAEHGIILGLLISLGIAVLGFIVPAPFFRMFTDDPVILDHAVRYIR
ncbi:MAG: MATE family efflux transporter, partial [Spirochaetales bacterium]|nr:MATE family efflux transporter [Spirochaetales bacterium]